MQRRARLFTLFSVSLLSLGSILLSQLATAADSVRVGTVTWIGYGPFYVADQLDLFKKSGVKVAMQIFADPALIPAAVLSGSVDAGMVTYDQVISQVAKGGATKVVMPIDYANGGDAIVATKEITKVSDFKGQKVAFNPLSPSDFLLSYALQSNGLTEKDVTPVNMTPEAVPAALASGGVKIGVTYEPTVSQVIGMDDGKKYHVVFSSKDAPGLITDVLIATTAYIKQNPKIIKALIQGYIDGLAYMKSNPAEAAKLIGKVMGVSDKEVMEQLPGIYNPTLEEFPKVFDKSKATTSFYTSGAVIARILKSKGEIKVIPKIEDTYDASLAKSMMKK